MGEVERARVRTNHQHSNRQQATGNIQQAHTYEKAAAVATQTAKAEAVNFIVLCLGLGGLNFRWMKNLCSNEQ